MPFHTAQSSHGDSNSEGVNDWFFRPPGAPALRGAPILKRSGGLRGGRPMGMRRHSDVSSCSSDSQQNLGVPRRRPVGSSSQSSSKHSSLESQISGQYLTPPPRNPARLSPVLPLYPTVPPLSSQQAQSPHHHLRRSSNVDGTTVSLLAANVISTTNNVFSAMVQHADESDSNSDSSSHDEYEVIDDFSYSNIHPCFRPYRQIYHPSHSYLPDLYSSAIMQLSHRR